MGKLRKELKQAKPFRNLQEEAILNVWRTGDFMAQRLHRLLKTCGISQTQYNVLRILRGAPDGLPCGEVARRLVTREPDITRLLDRMEKRGLISRSRETKDRRTVMTRITASGLGTVDRLDAPMQAIHHKQLGHLGRGRLQALLDLLRDARSKI